MVLRSTGPRTPRRWFPALTATLLVAFGALAPASMAERMAPQAASAPVAASSPSPELEAQFVSRINSLRASKGLRQLQVDGELTGVARSWTEQMVSNGQISHNPNLGSQVTASWTKLGENVGVGYDVDGLMQAFINSPAHYKNLVDPDWSYLGVGVVMSPDGRMWTTHNFMAKGANPAPAPAPAGPTTTRPHVATPPRTAAAATTTTAPPPPPPPPQPHPTTQRVTAVLTPLRSLERG